MFLYLTAILFALHQSGTDMKQAILLAAAAVSAMFGVSAASAADLPMKAAPPPVPVLLWTGFYGGINLGADWSNSDSVNHTAVAGPCNPAFAGCFFLPNYSTTLAIGSTFNSRFNNNAGFTGGGEFGYNWQFNGRGVAGIEADISYMGGQNKSVNFASLTANPNFSPVLFSQPYAATVTRNLDYLATVRGRLGFLAAPTFLIYGTGGLAFGQAASLTKESTIFPCGFALDVCTGFGGGSYLRTRVGWTAGVGGEWMMGSNWSAKVEYLYYDLGTANYATGLQSTCFGPTCAVPGGLFASTTGTTSVRFTGSIARVGIAYHFGG
jgi:outer membrane immunogenic protein